MHIYANSSETDEVGVVSLTGVNVESDPQKATLLGVSRFVATDQLPLIQCLETTFVYTFYLGQLPCSSSSEPQRTSILDTETRSDSPTCC